MKFALNTVNPSLKFSLFSVLALLLAACSMPKELEENDEIAQQLMKTPGAIQNHVLYMKGSKGEFKLHYVNSDPSNTPRDTVVFVHGTPDDWTSFARYFQEEAFTNRFRLISIDRPGWGKSTYPDSFPTHLQTQSNMIGPMLEDIWQQNGQQKVILVGHSLGGSLVPILAVDYPQFVRGVVILAGDLEPSWAAARWYNRLLNWAPDFAIPDKWNHSNMEVLALTESLTLAQPKLSGLTLPITLLQGTEDTLVDPKNADYAVALFHNSELGIGKIQSAGHLINLQYPDKVINAINDINLRSTQ
ncbi:alpha/beta fold hydrolase [Marinomonas profundimaris]|uniref:AB hydrolase-1 domain-containing protein n=1 Tax=Marinomonas profundimaris TaxID=1208321 RepID=W1S3K7_9GAMM|nr:alpha/beta hydrolase [Marinomonas profundimaris]ETI62594.1 hypothetical protein D104_00880 [Marinomonas profundimaris]